MATLAAGCNPQSLVHGHEREEADHDTETEEEVLVRLDHDEAHMVGRVLAKEDLWEEVEQCVTQ